MALTFVVIEEHARTTVQLGDNDALGTIDDEGTVVRHQGNFTHVNFLFFDIFDRFACGLFIKDNQAYFHAQRR